MATTITLPLKPFAQAVKSLAGVAANRSPLPVLECILLSLKSGQLTLAATNLEQGLVKVMDAGSFAEGGLAVPAKTLAELVGSLSGENVTLAFDATHLVVSTSGSKAKLLGILSDEFPPLPAPQEKALAVFEAGLLRACLGAVVVATSADEARPVLTSVAVQFGEQGTTFLAADGFTLARRQVKEHTHPQKVELLVPGKAAQFLIKELNGYAGTVEVLTSKAGNQVLFRLGGSQTVVWSAITSGMFPEVEAIIPKSARTSITLPLAELTAAVKQASIFAPKTGAVKLSVNGSVKVSSSNEETGKSEVELTSAQATGPNIEIAVNCAYLKDALTTLTTSNVEVGLNAPNTPLTLRPEATADQVVVIMPMVG